MQNITIKTILRVIFNCLGFFYQNQLWASNPPSIQKPEW